MSIIAVILVILPLIYSFAGASLRGDNRTDGTSPRARRRLRRDYSSCEHMAEDIFASGMLADVKVHPMDALGCLETIELDRNDALKLVESMRKLAEWHPTSKDPERNVFSDLDEIKAKIDNGIYVGGAQYHFEAVLGLRMARYGDVALAFEGTLCRDLVEFRRPDNVQLVSLSPDGVQMPKIYLAEAVNAGELREVVRIDGRPAVEALSFESQLWSFKDHHTKYNAMLLGRLDNYRGLDPMTGSSGFLRPMKHPRIWTEIILEGNELIQAETTATVRNVDVVAWNHITNDNDAYIALVKSRVDDPDDAGSVSGARSRRSIPEQGENVAALRWLILPGGETAIFLQPSEIDFVSPVTDLYRRSLADCLVQVAPPNSKPPTKLIIDLRGQLQGDFRAAYALAKAIFPKIDTGVVSYRFAKNSMAAAIGQNQPDAIFDRFPNVGGATGNPDTYVDTQNRPFESWADLYGDDPDFSNIFRYVPDISFSQIPGSEALFEFDDIALLSDGQCGSACTHFVLLLTGQVGGGRIRRIAIGGLPKPGRMTLTAATRMHNEVNADDLKTAFEYLREDDMLPADMPEFGELPIRYAQAQAGFAEIVRLDATTGQVPGLKSIDAPAHCRIFYTAGTLFDIVRLGFHVAEVAFGGPKGGIQESMCVEGSLSPLT